MNHDSEDQGPRARADLGDTSRRSAASGDVVWQPAGGRNDNLLHVWDGPTNTSGYLHRMDALSRRQGPGVVLLHSSPGLRQVEHRRPLHQVLEHPHRACLRLSRHGEPGLVLWWQTDAEEVWTPTASPEPAPCLEVPSMTKILELTGHTSRVLHLATSPWARCLRRP